MKHAKKPQSKAEVELGPLLTIREAAQRLRRNPMTVRRLIRARKLQAVLVAENVMVVERSLQDYLRPRPYAPQKPAPVCAGWNDKLRAELAAQQAPEAQS
jgi:excisionase family DNA binding protein